MFRLSVDFLLSDKWFIFKEKTIIFFFFLKIEGVQKVYKENSIILYFSKKKKKNKKIYILFFFSWLQCVVYDIFFFFYPTRKVSTDLSLKISGLHFRHFRRFCGNRNRCSNFAAKIELR